MNWKGTEQKTGRPVKRTALTSIRRLSTSDKSSTQGTAKYKGEAKGREPPGEENEWLRQGQGGKHEDTSKATQRRLRETGSNGVQG